MPADIKTLLSAAIHAIKLSILVFGPQVHTISSDVRTAKLQQKRIDIRNALESLGHEVRYAEELVDTSISGSAGNAFFQELLIMKEFDFIAVIVDSPGSITEATAISLKPDLALKASLFLDSAYIAGLVGQACQNAADVGAHFTTYVYPNDLDACNLLGHVLGRASQIQKSKYLL